MSYIAVVVSGLSGRMHSGFELISRLEGEGHRVICLCQPYTTETVAKQGFDYLEIPEINFKFDQAEVDAKPGFIAKIGVSSSGPVEPTGNSEELSQNSNRSTDSLEGPRDKEYELSEGNGGPSWFQKAVQHFSQHRGRYQRGKKILKLSEFEKIWQDLRPDRALIDVELHDLIFTAYASGIPVTLFHTWFSDVPSRGLPPIRTSITPGKDFDGSAAGIAWARFLDRFKIQLRYLINTLTFQEYRRNILKRYAREIGFPVKNLVLSTLPPLYRFTELPILLLAMRELDFPHRLAGNISYVGPMVYEKRVDLDKAGADGLRLQRLFTLRENTGKNVIYCTVGSLAKGDVAFLSKVISVAGREPDWLLVLSLGRNLTTDIFPDLPENVHLFSWVPQLEVLKHTDCCINHAGINSINECLHYAVPMLIYSLKYTDENGNAARMAYHGLAVVGDKDKDDENRIHQNIKAVLENPKYRENISKFSTIYQGYRTRKLTPAVFQQRE